VSYHTAWRLGLTRVRFAYNPAGNGRWLSLNLKKRKKAGGRRKPKKIEALIVDPEEQDEAQDDEMDVDQRDTEAADFEEAEDAMAVSRVLVSRKRSDHECRRQQSTPRNLNTWP
jgi:hypothetical protein